MPADHVDAAPRAVKPVRRQRSGKDTWLAAAAPGAGAGAEATKARA
jgi:hypothetical protein